MMVFGHAVRAKGVAQLGGILAVGLPERAGDKHAKDVGPLQLNRALGSELAWFCLHFKYDIHRSRGVPNVVASR